MDGRDTCTLFTFVLLVFWSRLAGSEERQDKMRSSGSTDLTGVDRGGKIQYRPE
jgi:hypothetical protein